MNGGIGNFVDRDSERAQGVSGADYEAKGVFAQLLTLAKDSIVYGFANVSSVFVGLFLMPLYTRVFSISEYGVIELITVATAVLALVAGMQVESGVARYYYEYEEKERGKLLFTGLLLKSAVPLAVCLALLPWVGQMSSALLGSSVYEKALSISLLTIPLSNLFGYFLLLLRFQWAKKKYAILAIGNTVVMMLLCIWFVAYLKVGIEGVFLGYLLAYATFTVAGLLLLRRGLTLSFSIPFARNILTYSIPVVPAVLVGWLRQYIDRFLLIPLVGLAGVGLYSAGIKVSSVILFVVGAFRLAWVPFSMFLINRKNHGTIYSKVLVYCVALLSLVGIIVVAFSQEILHLLTPAAYWDARIFVGFLVGGLILNGAFIVVAIGLNIVKKTYLNTAAFLAGVACGVTCLLVLTPRVGVVGAAMAALVASAVTLLVEFYLAQRNYYINYEWKRALLVFSIFAISVPVTIAVDSNLSGLPNIGLKVAEVVVLAFCMIKILPKAEVAAVFDMGRQKARSLVLALNSRGRRPRT